MKNGHVCNIPVTEGEITIVKGVNASEIMKHSCQVAMASRAAGAGVMVINTGLSKRRFKEAATEAGIEWTQTRNTNSIVSPGKVPLIIQTSVAGELSSELDMIREVCEEAKISLVVITGWEWTSSSYRRKEQLVFGLRQLLNDLDIAVIVYTQTPGRITSGEYARGGVGKLAMMAYDVVSFDPSEVNPQEETDLGVLVSERKPQPVLSGGAQLVPSKINELQEIFVDKAKGESRKAKIREMALAA